jgi:uncharacterized protein
VVGTVALLAALTGCSSGTSSTTPPSTGTAGSSGSTAVSSPAPDGFRAVTVTIRTADGRTVTQCLLVADSEALRQQGLMGVTDEDLGGYDGMLFVFQADSSGGFWMKDTLIPLSIAFADEGGAVVAVADMVPCPAATLHCPVTTPDQRYRYAVEVPAGALERVGLTEGSTLDPTLGAACTPSTT